MIEVFLTFPTPEGSRQIPLDGESLTVGRGAVDLRFDDQSLSRHHATIHHEGDRVWILDENSTNGTFVNGFEVAPAGTPLKNGDSIRLGNETIFTIQIRQPSVARIQPLSEANNEQRATNNGQLTVLIVAGAAVFIIGLSIIIIGASFWRGGNSNRNVVVVASTPEETPDDEPVENDNENDNSNSANSTPQNSNSLVNADSNDNVGAIIENPRPPEKPPVPNKTYLEMSDQEKLRFIETQSEQVARMIGNREGEPITPAAAARIKDFVDGFAKRLKNKRLEGACNFTKADLTTLLQRANGNAPFINRAFNSEGIAPQIGLYLAMIESEHCVCLRSPTGPLGMFQFTRATGATYGLDTRADASPTNPDERCQPEPAAKAAAKYMKFLMARYGTGPRSVPLAIASYNSGEGGLSTNLAAALEAAEKKERSFWTLMLVAEKLSAQFQKENRKYVPKFFAAAIIGENPIVFGVGIPPLSSNTK